MDPSFWKGFDSESGETRIFFYDYVYMLYKVLTISVAPVQSFLNLIQYVNMLWLFEEGIIIITITIYIFVQEWHIVKFFILISLRNILYNHRETNKNGKKKYLYHVLFNLLGPDHILLKWYTSHVTERDTCTLFF